jgi:hypothetical protein
MSKSTAPKRPQRRPKPMVKKSLDPPELVMLTHGKNTNFPAWKESITGKIFSLFQDKIFISRQFKTSNDLELS